MFLFILDLYRLLHVRETWFNVDLELCELLEIQTKSRPHRLTTTHSRD